jgi:TetR/AcrR family transcriptional regulator
VADLSELKRHRDPEATKEALLRAATELFAERGFDGVTVDEMAAKAGANKALISYYFRGKRGLYEAALRSALEVAVVTLRGLAESSRPPADLLRDFVAYFHRMATVERPYFPALVMREMLTKGEAFHQTVVPQVLALFQSVRAIIERGVREGSFRPVNPLAAHLGIIGSLLFFYATEPHRQCMAASGRLPMTPPTAEEFSQHIQEMVTRALAADPPLLQRVPPNTGEPK